MKNTFGQSLSVSIFGESHGEMIGATIDGISPGIKIDEEYINQCLNLRKPFGKISTQRKEADEYKIICGAFNGYTTGTPITIIIPNTNVKSSDYSTLRNTPRPGHADYTAELKYHGFQDARGGGHFSGRITAALVAVGAIIRKALIDKGIYISTHIYTLHGISDRLINSQADILTLQDKLFPVLDENAEKLMTKEIEAAAKIGDSVGGTLETVVTGIPAGVGEPFFDSVESMLAHALFSVPGIKGVEFGAGFAVANMLGSECNDAFILNDGYVRTKTNNNGGINGGITNGMPITFKCAVKPTPSIFKEQNSIDIAKNEETTIKINGRHDPAIIHRVRAVVDAVTAIAIADMLTTRFGTDYLSRS